ncbi:thiamine ABC transporter substrate binding subunit [Chelativorans sp. M5D2P16]|uniref:thiamine ABC transporter substrate binding subunit n=1 Tax=Chelativorans sp. M5D2P16 TaxID=3095678 RepID=UPI002ACAE92D|nr:thiamine ABC transporter substrate binding subunit [Chelativorans sp. M5D2P16]MDZ5699375.1 thiamine ABC transporter substrate binding subunit [Chelativorans sp. M5D2P16]
MRLLLACPALVFGLLAMNSGHAQETLTVYTYDSFTAEWGPGPRVEEAFETACGCDLEFVSVADGVALLNRVRLEGEGTQADIVLGLDTNLIHAAKETGLFAPHGIDPGRIEVPSGFEDDVFVPYDYGYFAFVYDTEAIEAPPQSLKELVESGSDPKIAIQDPRTSTPGLGLLLWVKAVYGDEAAGAWEKLRDNVVTVTPGWSESYGLFTSGEVPMVLSYTTSPAYHRIAEDTDRYRAASFEEGHYLQVEVAARTVKGADNPLAEEFLSFMTGPGFQDIIPETNWMFPAGETSEPLDPVFNELVEPAETLRFSPREVAENREAWVDEWLSVMSR